MTFQPIIGHIYGNTLRLILIDLLGFGFSIKYSLLNIQPPINVGIIQLNDVVNAEDMYT